MAEKTKAELQAELEKLQFDMGERLKELNCIYRLSDLMEDAGLEDSQVYQGIADVIDPSWQYPGETCGRVTVRGEVYVSDPFKETEWCQTGDVLVDGEKVGSVEVFYLTDKPDMGDGEGPFMKEERHLLEVICDRISERVRRRDTEREIEQYQANLERELAERTAEAQIYQHIVLNATDGIALVNLDAEIEEGNATWYELLGYDYDSAEMNGMSLEKLWPDEDVHILHDTAIPAAKAGQWRGEAPHVRKDGSVFVASITLYPLRNEEGEIAHYAKIIRDITEQKEQQQMIEEQSRAIMDMSTPVIKLWDEVILMPLIGVVDTSRTSQMLDALLTAVVDSEAKVAVLDVTGVPVIDTSVARHLLQAVDSSRILGAEVVITGFSPEAAQTLAQIGVDFSALRTRGSLRAGIDEAFGLTGRKVV